MRDRTGQRRGLNQSPGAVFALAWLALILLAAALAPVIASGHPILLHRLNGTGRIIATEYPLVRMLTSADWSWLVAAAAGIAALALGAVRARRGWWVALGFVVAAGIAASAALPRPPLTVFDYAEREARGEVRGVYTLIPWSPNERPGDRDARLLPPGTYADEPLAKTLRQGVGDHEVVNPHVWPILRERIDRLPVAEGRKIELRERFTAEGRKRSGLTGGEVERIAGDILRGGRRHLLGTDIHGQDVLSNMIHAARTAVSVALAAVGVAAAIGVLVGSLMGYFGGWVDRVLMRVVEVFMGVPLLFILVAAAAVLPRSLAATMIVLGCFTWMGAARFTRAEFLRLRGQDFVLAARAAGLPAWRVALRHMLPHAVAPVVIDASFSLAAVVVLEASLSYLGLGPPGRASWGLLMNSAKGEAGEFAWWLAAFPGLAVFLTALSYNIVGEALRDALDPRKAR